AEEINRGLFAFEFPQGLLCGNGTALLGCRRLNQSREKCQQGEEVEPSFHAHSLGGVRRAVNLRRQTQAPGVMGSFFPVCAEVFRRSWRPGTRKRPSPRRLA